MGTSSIILFALTVIVVFIACLTFVAFKRQQTRKLIKVKEARLRADEEIRLKGEEEARLKAEEEARLKAEEDAKLKAEEEARLKAEEDAKLKAEEEALFKAEEDTKLKAEEEARLKAEDSRLKAEEDVRLKAEEEARIKAEEDARLKAEEARLKAEETRLIAEEDARLKAEEEARLKAEKDAIWAAKLIMHKRAPEDRGGKPRTSSDKDENEKKVLLLKALKEKTLSLHPEVVCWKESRKWFLGIEIPEEFHECVGILVTQNDIQLDQDDRGRWGLSQLSGIIQIRWEEIGYQAEIRLDKPYLIFRLTGQRVNQGCYVRYATFGSYLIIVPDQWQRDEEISGIARLSPESISVSDYQAHYFILDRGSDTKIGFRDSTGDLVIIPRRASRFELVGSLLSDAHDDIGPLFTEHPPRIKAVDQNTWKGIKTIVLGQEGSGRKRWRVHFVPKPDSIEQFFPKELNHRRGGWYFVRFYDLEDTLVESMDFRFASALKQIVISPHLPLPDLVGHLSVSVKFIHNSECAIRLADGNEEVLQVQHMATTTVANIPPNPVWDRTRWSIYIDNKVLTETIILVQRVWWAIGDKDVAKVQPHWSDKPLLVPRESFSATSKQFLWLRFPKERWVDSVLVGFTEHRCRSYKVEVTKRYTPIPLSDFEGTQEFEDKFMEHLLNLWISTKEHGLYRANIIKILPDKPIIQQSDSQILNVKPIPDETVKKSHFPKVPEFSDLPIDRKCCSTCSFATINDLGILCLVGTWEERIDRNTFYYQYGLHSCSRWQGEYKDLNGIMVTK
jgi:actin-related protein